MHVINNYSILKGGIKKIKKKNQMGKNIRNMTRRNGVWIFTLRIMGSYCRVLSKGVTIKFLEIILNILC